MKFSSFSTILIFLVLILVGVALTPMLPFRLKPSDTLPSVSVSFSWQGADPRVVEQEVTSVLEGLFSRIRGVKRVNSSSSVGRGNITVEFDGTVDMDAVRFEMATLVRQVYPTFPERVSYPQIAARRTDKESTKPLISYTLNAHASPHDIQKYAEEKIAPVLSSLKGIDEVKIYGAMPMEWVMLYNADMMRTQQISANDIQSALNKYFSTGAAGQGYELQHGADTSVIYLLFRNYHNNDIDLLDIPVKKTGARIILLKDVVTLRHQEQPATSYYRINGANTINIVVYAGELENQLKTSKAIISKIKEVENNLPSGYFLLKSYDASEFVSQELMKNIWRAVLTVAILLVFVLIITRSWRYLLLIVFSLIANLSIAAIFYYFMKIEMHIYSLAGLTVSLSLIKNNSIVMIDHLRHQKNLKVFLAILAATLTAIAALIVAFFLDDKLKLSLYDFSIIMIVNLAVSLFVALFFIPALMDKIPLGNFRKRTKTNIFKKNFRKRRKRFAVKFTYIYEKIISFMCRFKWAFFILAVLGFGIPLHLLPEKINKENWLANTYNQTFGSEWYRDNLKNIAEKSLGGALRLFAQDSYENSYYGDVEKTTLYADAQMDHGSTLEQMNDLTVSIENYLKQFVEIDQFQANVNAGQASVVIYFKKEFEDTGFPFQLKEMLTQKAIDQGGADWNVQGVGEGFNNSVRESLGQYRITLYGYNYDQLSGIADQIKQRLMVNPRIKEVTKMSRNAWFKDLTFEYAMEFDRERLISQNVSPSSVYNSLRDYGKGDNVIGYTVAGGELERIRLESKQSRSVDMWQIIHAPGKIGKSMVRLDDVSKIKKETVSQDIVKENQQYKLILAYDYIGQDEMAREYQSGVLKEIEPALPIGYTVEGNSNRGRWDKKTTQQYWWLLLVIGVIFLICSVLFESLLLPLAVILMIPLSYIGIFLTFPIFNLNFDQGGFAAFILLSGITVSSALYIINDFNNLKHKSQNLKISSVRLYLKAYNQKIFPIMLTILSTSLGLIPFLSGGPKEVFWPALAAGTIGGLLFSLIGLWVYLPVLLLKRRK